MQLLYRFYFFSQCIPWGIGSFKIYYQFLVSGNIDILLVSFSMILMIVDNKEGCVHERNAEKK